MAGVRVLTAHDHPVVRDGLRAMLTSTGAAEVAAEAATGQQAVRETTLHHPGRGGHGPGHAPAQRNEATRQTVPANSLVRCWC